ncbi:MAG: PIG-L family deacetylase [Bdellovibrionota bacterium]
MNKYDAILFGAHPDDVEMGMGGTAIKLTKAGYKVLSVSLTQSEMSTYGDLETRKKEFEAAALAMACDCKMLDFQDTGVENNRESRLKISKFIRLHKPKIVFAPYHTNTLAEPAGIANVDHYETGAIVRDAVKYARLKKTTDEIEPHTVNKIYFYMVPRTIWANLVVDISEEIEVLVQAIEAYKSQLDISLHGKSIKEILLTQRAANGVRNGYDYAETFVSDQMLELGADDFFRL